MINVVNEEELLMNDCSTVVNCPASTKNATIDRVSCGSIIQREFINSNTSEEETDNKVVERRLIHFQSGHISCINNYLNDESEKKTFTTAAAAAAVE